jgi:ketosteroid isomerase-like protein
MSVETTQRTMEMWFKGDVAALSDDVVFEDMGNHMGRGREFRGRDAVGAWSNWLWSEPFEATPELLKMIVAENNAVLEFAIAGIHKGEFAGVAGTGREVRVPVCITYDLNEEGRITRGRAYVLVDTFLEQVGASRSAEPGGVQASPS